MADNKENLAKSFSVMENSMEKMWDMWLVSLGNVSSTQDQIEIMTRKQLDQNRTAREEMIKMVEDLSKQMRKNQGQFQKMVEEAILGSYEGMSSTSQSLISSLSNKVDELAKKVEKK